MSKIVFPVSSAPGLRPQVGSGRLLNCYAVKSEQGSRSPIQWLRSAGLRDLAFGISDHSHFRGGIEVGSTAILVLDERVYTVTESGGVFTAVNRGALAGTDPVTIAKNNAATPNIAAVCDAGTFNLFTASAPTSFADADWGSCNSIAGANGYLVGSRGDGTLVASDLNNVSVASNSNESTQMTLRRVVWFRGQLFAFSESKTKIYYESGSITDPFPFRYTGTEIPAGICGTHAVAGYEEGWIGQLLWVGDDNTVRQLDGNSATIVSNDDVSRAIASASDRTLIEASVYMANKYAFFVITSPNEWTWELNVTTGGWNERASYGQDDWRGRRCIRAFDRWIAGDDDTGGFAQIDSTYRREYNDGALIFHLESGDNAAFPHPVEVGGAYFDFAVGVGEADGEDPVTTDPKVMLSFSLNGGFSWGAELLRSLGQQGQGNRRVGISNCGTTRAQGIRYRVRVSDPVDVVFLGGEMPDVKAMAA